MKKVVFFLFVLIFIGVFVSAETKSYGGWECDLTHKFCTCIAPPCLIGNEIFPSGTVVSDDICTVSNEIPGCTIRGGSSEASVEGVPATSTPSLSAQVAESSQPTAPSPAATSPAQERCYLSGRCRQIDEVWLKIGKYLVDNFKDKVWDIARKTWLSFNEAYAELGPSVVSTEVKSSCVAPVPSGNKYNPSGSLHRAPGSGHGWVRCGSSDCAVDLRPGNNCEEALTSSRTMEIKSPIDGFATGVFGLGDGTGDCVIVTSTVSACSSGSCGSPNVAILCHIDPRSGLTPNTPIQKGEVVGKMTSYPCSSPSTFGPHLHFELKVNGEWIRGDGFLGTWTNQLRTLECSPDAPLLAFGESTSYQALYENMGYKNEKSYEEAKKASDDINQIKEKYLKLERLTGLPWYILGVIHYREGSLSFEKSVRDGSPLSAGETWEGNAYIVIEEQKFKFKDDYLKGLEWYNGLAYKRSGLPSPYLWSGSTYYEKGKYVGDGIYDQNRIDDQIGAAVILKVMEEKKYISPLYSSSVTS